MPALLDYDQYRYGIRREYSHMSAPDYCSGRANVLRKFADRPVLYFTALFRDRLEVDARRNIGRELAILQRFDADVWARDQRIRGAQPNASNSQGLKHSASGADSNPSRETVPSQAGKQ